MMRSRAVAKGKQILADLINALGGPGYTEVEKPVQGRRVLFWSQWRADRHIEFAHYRRYPDKDRTDTSARAAIRSSLL